VEDGTQQWVLLLPAGWWKGEALGPQAEASHCPPTFSSCPLKEQEPPPPSGGGGFWGLGWSGSHCIVFMTM
jgi:hypothetical protein